MRHFVCNTMHFNCITSSLIAVNYPCVCSAQLLEPSTWLLEPLHTMAAAKRFLMGTPGFIRSLVWYYLFTLYSLSSHWTDRVPWQIPKKTQGKSGWPYNTFLKQAGYVRMKSCLPFAQAIWIIDNISSFKPKHCTMCCLASTMTL